MSIKLYPVDPTTNPTNTGSFVSTGSAQSVWLEYVDGTSATQLVECTLTNGSEKINGGAEDAWVFRSNTNGQIFVLTSGGYTVAPGNAVQINSSITLSDLDQLVAEQASPVTTTLSALDISADSGTDGDFVTNTAAQTVTATLSTVLASGEKLLGSVDGGTTWVDVSGFVSGTALAWTGVTLSGTSSLQLKATDLASNDGPVATQAYTLDIQAPAVTVQLSQDNGVSPTDQITSDAGLSGTGEPGTTVTILNGTTALATAVIDGQGDWSLPGPALGLSDGAYTLTASVTDAAGNTGTAPVAFTLSAVPPAPSISALITNDATPALSGSWGGANGGTDTLSVAFGGATYTAGISPELQVNGTAWVLQLPGPLVDGAYDVTATTARVGGQSAQTTANGALTIDTVAPTVTFGLTRDSNAFSTVGIVRTEALTGTGTPGATLEFFEGNTAIGTALVDANGAWIFRPTGMDEGARTIVARETDAAGNTGTASLAFHPVVAPTPSGGDSVTLWRSMDLAQFLNSGGKLQLPAGAERVVLADGTLTVGDDPSEALLTRMYFGVLGRAPEADGIAGWQHSHERGLSKASLAEDFLRAAESLDQGWSEGTNAEFVQDLYQGVLGRQGEAWEVAQWTALLDAGDTRGAVLAGIADSPEAKDHWSGVIAEGVWVRDLDAAVVRAAYLAGLGREAETEGLRMWSGALQDGARPGEVGAWISTSAEFQARHAQQDDTSFIESLYADGLGRPGEAQEVAHWVDALHTGSMTRGDVLMAFAQSEEGQHHLYWAL
ncbi:DUF4214 domain-containing protein [Muricoccus pecuniae]|uniref:DUF4214 domain-containing protein n=1 Tax=Muricoccus pecuniae TaxID=693023 RepID=A0A840Y0W4_9PROT|nr:DUF4214 domain-containing protein [Roseomonas pecuniae]MBB5694355.1 hypothetical protein [Roseomonas pecuniae]